MIPRKLTPELLALLPPDDLGAVASRRDLVRITWVMRQHGDTGGKRLFGKPAGES